MSMLAIIPIKIYQIFSSAFTPRCKYYPSCSNYAITAIRRHKVKGLFMAIWRVMRCNPWSHGGVDYVDAELDSADAIKVLKNKHLEGVH